MKNPFRDDASVVALFFGGLSLIGFFAITPKPVIFTAFGLLLFFLAVIGLGWAFFGD